MAQDKLGKNWGAFSSPSLLTLTPPKINIEPENDGWEDDYPFPGWYSQVPC